MKLQELDGVYTHLKEYHGIKKFIQLLLANTISQHLINSTLQDIMGIVALPNFWERIFYGRPRNLNNIIYFEQVVMNDNYVQRPGGIILKLGGNKHLHIRIENSNRSHNGDNYWQPIIVIGIADSANVEKAKFYAIFQHDIGNANPFIKHKEEVVA